METKDPLLESENQINENNIESHEINYEKDFLLLQELLEDTEKTKSIFNFGFINFKNIKISLSFLSKYLLTSFSIFMLLMVTTNYKAYINIANSYIQKDEVAATNDSLLNSVKATNITNDNVKEQKKEKNDDAILNNSLKTFVNLKEEKPSLDIDITPYENRIIIPKIGKNIPLLDIKNRTVTGQSELNDIFMKELEKGVIRYPGSVKPGEIGNSFIFGHSSNFPWVNGDFNDVFSTLNNVTFGDEIIVYYNQKKYVYTIKQKSVISPGNVSIFKGNKTKAQVMIMTCWPIGTTLNRLVVTGELKEVK
ncbi:MAG: sortase [Candidatus Gracilibacteria bacterium]